MAIAPTESLPQFLQNHRRWRHGKTNFAALANDSWLPTAVHTAPLVALEALDPQCFVLLVIPALNRLDPLHLLRLTVGTARSLSD